MLAEEEEIRAFISRIFQDTSFRDEFGLDPNGVLEREHLSPRTRLVLKKLNPLTMREHLAQGKPLPPSSSFMQ